jgi:hypothetical protein
MAAGFHPHLAGAWHRYGAKALGASMWFWMMYRAKQDMPVLLVCIFSIIVKHSFQSLFTTDQYRAGDILGTAMVTATNMLSIIRAVLP